MSLVMPQEGLESSLDSVGKRSEGKAKPERVSGGQDETELELALLN